MTPDGRLHDTLPYLTSSMAGIGGRIRTVPEDFLVEERPLYLPCGEGEHLYLRITKRGLSTPDLVKRLASMLGVKAMQIGVAGLKDARAVTTQMVSVHGATEAAVNGLCPDAQVLSITVLGRHRNRLRTGHHAGNRFRLVIREVSPQAAVLLPLLLENLTRRGVPNYFGPQRQGRSGDNFQVGAALLQDAGRRARMSRSKRLWFLHALQSHLFNRVLARRISQLDHVLIGDWAMKHANGACFLVEDAEKEQPRAETFEISPTGPLFGSRAPWAEGEPGRIEREVAAELGATPESLTQAAVQCGFRGERRALRVPLKGVDWSLSGDSAAVSFDLPPGSYATSVLRELLKTEVR